MTTINKQLKKMDIKVVRTLANINGERKHRLTAYKKRFLRAYNSLIKLGVSESTINLLFGMNHNGTKTLRSSDSTLQAEYETAMESIESHLVGSMVIQALGYNYEEVKVVYRRIKDGEKADRNNKGWISVKRERLTKHQPGNSALFQFLMTNKFGDNWKNSKEIVSKKEGYDSSPSKRARKQIESLARDIPKENTVESN